MTRLDEATPRTQRQASDLAGRPAERNRLELELYVDNSARLPIPGRSEETPAPWPVGQRPAATPEERSPVRARRLVLVGLVLALGAAGVVYFQPGVSGILGDSSTSRLTGVVAANQVLVAAQIGGRITRLDVREGSWVKQGDLIGLLDRHELNAERRHQLALIEQLSAKLQQTREVVSLEGDRGRGRVASAEAQWQAAQSQRDEATATLEQLHKDAQRVRSLFEGGLVSRQDVERAETEVRVTEARLKSLTEQVVRANAELELARANAGQAGLAEHDVEQTRAQLRQAEAQLAQVTARLDQTEVRAPLAGMVSVQVAREGEVIGAGNPIVTLVDLDDVWVRAQVEESYVGRIAIGQELDVEMASGEHLQGQITFIAPEAEFATQRDVSRVKRDIRTFAIKVALPNPDRRLHQGMTAYVLLPEHVAASTAAR